MCYIIRSGDTMLKDKLTLDEVVDLLPPATSRSVQLERPQEVGGVLEVGANRQDLRDFINQNRLHIKCKIFITRQE